MNNNSLRISTIVSFTYPFIGSGIGNVALLQSEYLAKKKNTVTLVSSNIPQTQKKFTYKGVHFIKIQASNILYKHNIPVPLFFFPKEVISVIKDSDIIHIHDLFYPSSLFAVIFAQLYNKPVFLTQHIPYIRYENPLLNFLQKLVFHTFGEYILWYTSKIFYFNSEVGELLKKYQSKLVFLPNGTDVSLFHPVTTIEKRALRKKYQLPIDKSIILFVGRLVPKKGYDLLYAARSTKYIIVFVGGGTVPESYRNHETAIFLGEKTQSELSELYQLSDIFILPSHSEGCPLSVQEAMATGLPLIVSNLQCYKDLGLDRNLTSFIAPHKDTIKTAISDLLSDPVHMKKMSEYSRSHALRLHTWEKHVAVLMQTYREVLR